MSVKIYKDQSANAIFIEDSNGVQFLNTLQATVSVDLVTIVDLARDIDIVSDVLHTDFIDENDAAYSGTSTDVCNALNALFYSSGTASSNLPVITSNLTASIVQGETLNYELTATNGVATEFDLSNVSGVSVVDGQARKIVGGSGLESGTYSIPVKSINYNGEDSETLVLTVSEPPYANTKSVAFVQNDYLSGSASDLSGVLGRAANGAGSGDAWTISLYFKAGTHTGGAKQTLFYFGDTDHTNGGHVWIYYKGNEQKIYLEYGSAGNYLRFKTADDSTSVGAWLHLAITYDGGTTGSSSGSISDYHSRFSIFIDGTTQLTTNQHSNYGWSSGIDSDVFTVGRSGSTNNWLKNECKIDELAVWGTDETANISSIYNSGTPHSLSTLGSPPLHWWRLGDGDTYPTLIDSIDSTNLTMNSMTSADIVSDVP
tara:strand:- start:360 stop:1646 length:1287 start_codon:yes stop_codon:yes gene_type:complete